MTRTIRIHLDENCPNALADGLLRRGVDVTTTPEVGLRGVSDSEQLSYAASSRRVLFTQDHDFLIMHASGMPHSGILYCRQHKHALGELIQSIVLVWEVLEAEDLLGVVEFL